MQKKSKPSRHFLKMAGVSLFLCLFLLFTFYIKKGMQAPKELASIEGPVDNFTLIDQQGVFHELYNYTDQKGVVLISHGNGCPLNRQVGPYLNRLKEQYEQKGIKFLKINANSKDDRFSIAKEAEEFDIRIPILEDRSQVIAADLNFAQTGEAIVLNTDDWSIIYRGAIHGQLRDETEDKKADTHYLKDAINALIEKKAFAISKTQAEGCIIDLKEVYSQKQISFVKDVAPILINRCVRCHFEGIGSPWVMNDYETIKSWSPLLRETIRTKRMPPVQGDPYDDIFGGNNTLSPEETRTLVRWVEQGALRGEGEDPLKKYVHYE